MKEPFEVETMHQLYPLTITPEHPVLCLSGAPKGINYNVIRNRIDKCIIANEWKDVKDLTTDDMIAYSIPTYEKDVSSISSDDCYFYLLGDGYFENDNKNGQLVFILSIKKIFLNFVNHIYQIDALVLL